MTSTYKGLQVPDYTDLPDGPADFRGFADSLTAAAILGQVGSVVKATGVAALSVSATAWAIVPTATLPQPTTLGASSLLLVRLAVDVSPKVGGVSFGARVAAQPASSAFTFEGTTRAVVVATALIVAPAGALALDAEIICGAAAGATVNSVTWNIFSTGAIT